MAKSAPKAPDYAAAAEKQAQGSREVTEQQSWANRPDQITPWGTQSWQNQAQWDPSTQQYLNRWTQTTDLNPESQRALDAQMGLTTGRSELGASMFPRAQQEFGKAIDWNQFDPAGQGVKAQNLNTSGLTNLDSSQKYRQDANDAIYNQWASRALPEQDRQTESARTRLYNMGLREGDESFDREMTRLGEQQGDAQRQAQYQATIGSGAEAQRMLGMDASTRGQLFGERGQMGQQNFGQQMQSSQYNTQLRQQQIAEEMNRRGFSLNEINAIISGQQVGMPSMPGFNQATRAEGTQNLAAAQMQGQADLDRYNAQQQATQGMMSGMGSMAGGFMMSDRRYKTDITRIGATPGGFPLYSFRYIFGGPEMIGVMADEVPHATVKVAGINFVDYSKVY
jgi:hypothetical protein